MLFVTSNENKLREFREYFPEIRAEKGADLPEVDADPDTVVLYKALAAGAGRVVEDTILTVEGEEVVDVRWKIEHLPVGASAVWEVRLGYNDGNEIHIYKGEVPGKIVEAAGAGFGFDPVFLPEGSDKTLGELGEKKRLFSARRLALEAFKNGRPWKTVKISEVPEWTGDWQGGEKC